MVAPAQVRNLENGKADSRERRKGHAEHAMYHIPHRWRTLKGTHSIGAVTRGDITFSRKVFIHFIWGSRLFLPIEKGEESTGATYT